MTDKEFFYQKIEDEFNEYLSKVADYDEKDLYNEVETIADMKEIFHYLMREKPIDGDMLEHYLMLKNPLAMICQEYEEYDKQPIYDRLNHTIWRIDKEKILDYKKNTASEKLKEIMRSEFSEDGMIYGEELKLYAAEALARDIFEKDFCFDEYDAKVLMQFQKPFYVLLDNYRDTKFSSFHGQYKDIMERLMSMDLLTGKYALKKDMLLPETKFRHAMINKIIEFVPEPDYTATSNWLAFFRDIQISCNGDENLTENPYEYFGEALETVAYQYGDDIIQKIYDLAKENQMILTGDMLGAAEYLSNGGSVLRVHQMAEEGKFETLFASDEQQGGMNLC